MQLCWGCRTPGGGVLRQGGGGAFGPPTPLRKGGYEFAEGGSLEPPPPPLPAPDGQLRGQCSGSIAQCLNLEREFHHAASKLCIFGFEPLKQSLIARVPPTRPRCFSIPDWLPRTFTRKLQAQYIANDTPPTIPPSPNHRLNGTVTRSKEGRHARDAPLQLGGQESTPPTQVSHFVSARPTPPALHLNLRRGNWLRHVDTFC